MNWMKGPVCVLLFFNRDMLTMGLQYVSEKLLCCNSSYSGHLPFKGSLSHVSETPFFRPRPAPLPHPRPTRSVFSELIMSGISC